MKEKTSDPAHVRTGRVESQRTETHPHREGEIGGFTGWSVAVFEGERAVLNHRQVMLLRNAVPALATWRACQNTSLARSHTSSPEALPSHLRFQRLQRPHSCPANAPMQLKSAQFSGFAQRPKWAPRKHHRSLACRGDTAANASTRNGLRHNHRARGCNPIRSACA